MSRSLCRLVYRESLPIACRHQICSLARRRALFTSRILAGSCCNTTRSLHDRQFPPDATNCQNGPPTRPASHSAGCRRLCSLRFLLLTRVVSRRQPQPASLDSILILVRGRCRDYRPMRRPRQSCQDAEAQRDFGRCPPRRMVIAEIVLESLAHFLRVFAPWREVLVRQSFRTFPRPESVVVHPTGRYCQPQPCVG
jgi:hypothetical protein